MNPETDSTRALNEMHIATWLVMFTVRRVGEGSIDQSAAHYIYELLHTASRKFAEKVYNSDPVVISSRQEFLNRFKELQKELREFFPNIDLKDQLIVPKP